MSRYHWLPTLRDRLGLYRQRLGDKEQEGLITEKFRIQILWLSNRLEKNEPKKIEAMLEVSLPARGILFDVQ